MWAETWQRVIDILKTLGASPVPDTYCTVTDFTPKSRSDIQGYMIRVIPTRDALTPPVAQGIKPHNMAFTIECTSPQINTGFESVQEYHIMAYADVITALIDQYPQLNNPSADAPVLLQGLRGVNQILLGGAVFQTPASYPSGGTINHYSFTMSLSVSYDRVSGC